MSIQKIDFLFLSGSKPPCHFFAVCVPKLWSSPN